MLMIQKPMVVCVSFAYFANQFENYAVFIIFHIGFCIFAFARAVCKFYFFGIFESCTDNPIVTRH